MIYLNELYSLVSAVGVLAPTVSAGVGQLVALVDVEVAAGALEDSLMTACMTAVTAYLEAGSASAAVALGQRDALRSVPAGLGGAVIHLEQENKYI